MEANVESVGNFDLLHFVSVEQNLSNLKVIQWIFT